MDAFTLKEIRLLRWKTKNGSTCTSWKSGTLTVPVAVFRNTSALYLRLPLCSVIIFSGCLCFLFCDQNAFKVWALSREDDRGKQSMFHHSWDWTKPPRRHWDCQENDQNGKGNKLNSCRGFLQVNMWFFFSFILVFNIQFTPAEANVMLQFNILVARLDHCFEWF